MKHAKTFRGHSLLPGAVLFPRLAPVAARQVGFLYTTVSPVLVCVFEVGTGPSLARLSFFTDKELASLLLI